MKLADIPRVAGCVGIHWVAVSYLSIGFLACSGEAEVGFTLRDPAVREVSATPKPGGAGGDDTPPPLSPPPLSPPPLSPSSPSGPPPPPPPEHAFAQSCCAEATAPGCGKSDVMECVCDLDPFCCSVSWDGPCVEVALDRCDLSCQAASGPPVDLPPDPVDRPSDDCCVAHGGPSCDQPDVAACVCSQDSYCCDTAWDDLCLALIAVRGCGPCDAARPPPSTTPLPMPAAAPVPAMPPPVTDASCCEANRGPGCDDTPVLLCVCASDPYCCQVAWDGECVDNVAALGCAVCP